MKKSLKSILVAALAAVLSVSAIISFTSMRAKVYADSQYITEELPEGYEDVITYADFASAIAITGGSGGSYKTKEDITVGRFTFATGLYFEQGNGFNPDGYNVNNQKKKISFTLNGTYNAVAMDIKGASSGVDSTLKLYKDGSEYAALDGVENGTTALDQVFKDLPAGNYYIQSSDGALRIKELRIVERLEKSAPTGISVSTASAKTDFLQGEEFSSLGVSVFLDYANGNQQSLSLSDCTVDSTAFDKDVAGTYTIKVKYDEFDEVSYDVNVYAAESLSLFDHIISSASYNGININYVTKNIQKVFLRGSAFNYDNLTVKASASCPGIEGEKEFVVPASAFTVSEPDMIEAGEKTVTITAFGKTADYKINVVDNFATMIVSVDASAEVSVSEDGVVFKTINDALTYYKLIDVGDIAKTIFIASGEYYEKIEVDMPSVSLIAEDPENKPVIIYDALAGKAAGNGAVYSTDGSATFSVRPSATDFFASGIVFKNYYETAALYEEAKVVAGSGTQGVAVIVQGDRAVFNNCEFYGYQDTLDAQLGRQYYKNCYISGVTDYIFGYNATAYFDGCTIHSIKANSNTNNGYIVATKGLWKGLATDAIEYGYIFDNCTIEGDDNVVEGTVSIARGWDTNMRVAVINSTISNVVSKEAYGDNSSSKNDRYGKMNAAPNAEYLLEYNNTGDGAISESIEGTCTVIDADKAAQLSDFSVIFGKNNGKVVYEMPWDIVVSDDDPDDPEPSDSGDSSSSSETDSSSEAPSSSEAERPADSATVSDSATAPASSAAVSTVSAETKTDEKKGCSCAIGISSAVLGLLTLAASAFAVVKKKKED